MTRDPRLDDLLLDWEQGREQGRTLSAEELCRDCPELLPALRGRIQALQVVDAMLGPDANPTPPSSRWEPSSDHVGALLMTRAQYRVLRLHARGGLGEVLVARDEDLQREVALKRIQRPLGRDTDRRAR